MAYVKQTFVDGVTVLSAEHLEHIEDGIIENEQRLDEGFSGMEEALDGIIEIQNTLIGGDEE